MRPHRSHGISSARIGIVDLGRTGCRVFLHLVARGCRRFSLADSRPVLATDLDQGSLLRPQDVGWPRGWATAARLRDRAAEIEVACHPGPEVGLGWQQSWLADCDLCLLASELTTAAMVLEVNAACLHAAVPLISGLVMGRVGHLGPLVRPGAGPCLRCVDLRVTATAGASLFRPVEAADPAMIDRISEALAAQAELFLAGGDDLRIAGTVVHFCAHGAATTHPVLGAARCPDCSPFGPFMPYRFARHFDLGDRSPTEPDLDLASRLVSPWTGPLRSIDQAVPTARDPAIPHWTATITDTGALSMGVPVLMSAGCDLDPEVGRAAAIAEGVERLASAAPSPADVFIATYRAMADQAVDPRTWDVFHPQTRKQPGFPFSPPAHEVPTSWVWGYSLTAGVPQAVPAARVFAVPQELAPGDRVDLPILSGFASGTTLEEAAWHGLLEVVERDAFMIAWANRLPLRRVAIDRDSPHQVGAYLGAFEERGFEVRCSTVALDLGAHLVVAIAGSSAPGEPARWIAAAADPDLANACRRAIKELVTSRIFIRGEMQRAGGRLPQPVPEQVVDMGAHGLLYARPEMARHLKSWWNPDSTVSLPEPPPRASAWSQLERTVKTIAAAGLEVLVVDLTPPEIRELGLWAVKTLVPGTYPMNFDSRWPHFGGRRMYEVPVRCGLRPKPLAFGELNRVPHPFP